MASGYRAAVKYAYSSAKVRAMRSKLLEPQQMQSVIAAKDISSMLSVLLQSNYSQDIIDYGGMNIKSELVDFALSKNLAQSLHKLIAVTPADQRDVIMAMVGKWDLYNVKLAIEAKVRKLDYDAIARYVIDYGIYNHTFIKEVMREQTIEAMLSRMMLNSPYRQILQLALNEYTEHRNAANALATIDREHYVRIGKAAADFAASDREASEMLKTEIDMSNVLSLIRAKRQGLPLHDAVKNLVPYGRMQRRELDAIYAETTSVEALVRRIHSFNLERSLEVYSKNGRVLAFEIGMKNSLFEKGLRLLGHTVLSFSTILAYVYLKEIEVYTLRISINGRNYGLSQEDLSRLMVWKR